MALTVKYSQGSRGSAGLLVSKRYDRVDIAAVGAYLPLAEDHIASRKSFHRLDHGLPITGIDALIQDLE
jgi:hypothetical protein